MKLGDVLKKERERKKLTPQDVASKIGIDLDRRPEIEHGDSPAEEYAPRLALIAIKLKTLTSRLLAESGKAAHTRQVEGQCSQLIERHRNKQGPLLTGTRRIERDHRGRR